METHIVTIKPPLQILDVGNGCKAFSDGIYIPAKSELTATLQLITRSLFFLDYNFNYTNVSNFLIWYKLDFVKLTDTEIKTLKAKVLQLPYMSMDMFDNVLDNIDENYPFTLSIKLGNCGHMYDCLRNNIHMVQKENYSFYIYYGKLN